MSRVLTIITDDAPGLHGIAGPVIDFDHELRRIIGDLQATLADFRLRAGFGRAIAAPQVDIPLRIIALQLGARPFTMINPRILWRSDAMQEVWDDCLSVPEAVVRVRRHLSISVAWQDEQGFSHQWDKLPPDMSELIQHEIDHLDGILMTDRAIGADAIRPIAERSALIDGQRPAHRLSLDHIRQAPDAIDPVFLNTPQYECPQLSAQLGRAVWLKVETINPLRCFKGRGAGLVIAGALARGESRPLVCASAGNWGLALAYYCHKASLPLTVFAAQNANPLKIEAIAAYGADIRQVGADFDSAKEQGQRYCGSIGGWFIEDGLEPEVSEGAGTIALELLSACVPFRAIYIPVGNGALIGGMARWIKASAPDIRIIGVCPRGADAMYQSWLTHRVVIGGAVNTQADGLAVRVPVPQALEDMRDAVDEMILVEEEQITVVTRYALKYAGLILEPSGAVSLAGILSHSQGESTLCPGPVAAILTGANIACD